MDSAFRICFRFVKFSDLPSRFIGASISRATDSTTSITNENFVAFNAPSPHGDRAWLFLSPAAKAVRFKMSEESEKLSSIAIVKQGIKTGANDIFIVSPQGPVSGALTPVVNALGDSELIETDMLRPVIYGSNIQRYDNLTRPTSYVIYPVRGNGVLSEGELRTSFPRTFSYLSKYYDFLSNRQSIIGTGKSWYELSSKRNEDWLSSEKLLIRDLASETSFAIDQTGSFFLVGGTAVIPSDPDLLLPLLVYLNSRLVNWYMAHTASSYRDNFFKFEPQHLSDIPVMKSIVEDELLRDELTASAWDILLAKQSGNTLEQAIAENRANLLICDMAGIRMEEIT